MHNMKDNNARYVIRELSKRIQVLEKALDKQLSSQYNRQVDYELIFSVHNKRGREILGLLAEI